QVRLHRPDLSLQVRGQVALLLHHIGRRPVTEAWVRQLRPYPIQVLALLLQLLSQALDLRGDIDQAAQRHVHLEVGVDVTGGRPRSNAASFSACQSDSVTNGMTGCASRRIASSTPASTRCAAGRLASSRSRPLLISTYQSQNSDQVKSYTPRATSLK